MRFSVQSQALFEVALIQISQLQDLATIAKIIEAVQQGGPMPAAPKPAAPRPAVVTPPAAQEKKNVEVLNVTPVQASRPAATPTLTQACRLLARQRFQACTGFSHSDGYPCLAIFATCDEFGGS